MFCLTSQIYFGIHPTHPAMFYNVSPHEGTQRTQLHLPKTGIAGQSNAICSIHFLFDELINVEVKYCPRLSADTVAIQDVGLLLLSRDLHYEYKLKSIVM